MDIMNVTENLENLFNKVIIKDYLKQYDSSKEWYVNVRNYIEKTTEKLDEDEDIEDIDDIREKLTDDLSEKIVSESVKSLSGRLFFTEILIAPLS